MHRIKIWFGPFLWPSDPIYSWQFIETPCRCKYIDSWAWEVLSIHGGRLYSPNIYLYIYLYLWTLVRLRWWRHESRGPQLLLIITHPSPGHQHQQWMAHLAGWSRSQSAAQYANYKFYYNSWSVPLWCYNQTCARDNTLIHWLGLDQMLSLPTATSTPLHVIYSRKDV